MLCITDANIWIDLDAAGFLARVFDLEDITWQVPDLVLDDELLSVDPDVLLRLGAEEVSLSPEQVLRAAQLAARYRRPSETDLAALVLAADADATLVTGDGALREAAQAEGVLVHGVLWLLDVLVAEAHLNPPTAADGLEAMLAEGARLPKGEVAKRLRLWRD